MKPHRLPGQDGGLVIDDQFELPIAQVELYALRSGGPGGQHVNTTSSAIELRFDVATSSLPEDCKERLLASRDRRLSRAGVLVIKSQQHRSQLLNRRAALERLADWIAEGLKVPEPRKATRIPRSVRRRRLEGKARRGSLKQLRGRMERGSDPD